MATAVRRKALEQLLLEATGNQPRSAVEGSVRLYGDGLLDWTERTRSGPVARSGLVDWERFWDLVDEALAPADIRAAV